MTNSQILELIQGNLPSDNPEFITAEKLREVEQAIAGMGFSNILENDNATAGNDIILNEGDQFILADSTAIFYDQDRDGATFLSELEDFKSSLFVTPYQSTLKSENTDTGQSNLMYISADDGFNEMSVQREGARSTISNSAYNYYFQLDDLDSNQIFIMGDISDPNLRSHIRNDDGSQVSRELMTRRFIKQHSFVDGSESYLYLDPTADDGTGTGIFSNNTDGGNSFLKLETNGYAALYSNWADGNSDFIDLDHGVAIGHSYLDNAPRIYINSMDEFAIREYSRAHQIRVIDESTNPDDYNDFKFYPYGLNADVMDSGVSRNIFHVTPSQFSTTITDIVNDRNNFLHLSDSLYHARVDTNNGTFEMQLAEEFNRMLAESYDGYATWLKQSPDEMTLRSEGDSGDSYSEIYFTPGNIQFSNTGSVQFNNGASFYGNIDVNGSLAMSGNFTALSGIKSPNLPVYPDQATASTHLSAGWWYVTPTGEPRIVI